MAVSAPAAAERSAAKAGASYSNAEWDVVDRAEQEGGVGAIAEEDLPSEMKGMSKSERETYVAKKAKERAKVQSEIKDLSSKRQEYIAQKQKEAGETDATLGSSVINSVRAQAQKEGFTL